METSKRRTATALLAVDLILGTFRQTPVAKADEPTPRVSSGKVTLLRVPNGGIQPQAMVDANGVVHLIYFAGDPRAGDIFYVRSKDGERFSPPLRVNNEPASAIAVGNIRGAHLALGKGARVHVAWMGSDKAKPRGPSDSVPMLYARLNDAVTEFEPQRNLIQKAVGLDGGGSVAADDAGNVYVMWHAPEPGARGEDKRCVWLSRSVDNGKTFGQEARINPDPTGACGCCGMRAFADKDGTLYALYRSATEQVHRDMYLLVSTNHGDSFRSTKIDPWNVRICPMSSMAFGASSKGTMASWETGGQVYFSLVDPTSGKPSRSIAAPGQSRGRKHSVVAANSAGESILVWTEGMGWNKAGSLAWHVFDETGKPSPEKGRAPDVPAWSVVAVFAEADGRFTIIY
jgi:hypothetical protein